MCGISGIHRRDGSTPDPSALAAMGASIAHRGPDDDGHLALPGVGFAFRRLSIIDLEGGHQPIPNEDRSVWVQLNGEIYNYRELRAQLLGTGHVFATDSDTEVIVHGYEEWGLGVLDRLNGMFGLAIWDHPNQKLVLARDHLGIKPVYHHDDGRCLRFGSEMRAILADPAVSRALDPDAIRLLLHFGYLPSPHTPLRGIERLRPGHVLVSTPEGSTVHRFWDTTPVIDHTLSVDDATECYHAAVTAAVGSQLVADVPVGCLLSGGVDSAMVLAAANKASSTPLTTFTVGFGPAFSHDEMADAAETAALLGSPHVPVHLDGSAFSEIFDRTVWHLEEPVLSQSTFAFHHLTAEVRRHLKVVLTGQGADEPWAGYDRYLGERYGGHARWLLGSSLAHAVGEALPGAARLRRATASLGESDPIRRFAAIHQVFSPAQVADIALGPVAASDARAEDVIEYWQRPVAHLDEFSQLLHVDTRMSLPDDLLLYGDKLSMANGVEARVPLLDRHVVELIETLPPSHKLRGRRGKRVHKGAARRMLPSSVVDRPKRGFATPIDRWFADELTSLLDRTVLAPDSHCAQHLRRDRLVALVEEHRSGRRNHRRPLTLLLSFEISARQLLEPDRTPVQLGDPT